jgi:hypothetical protein
MKKRITRELDPHITRTLKAADLALVSEAKGTSHAASKVGRNPYQGASAPETKKLRQRSGLDYLRTLSGDIKRRNGK